MFLKYGNIPPMNDFGIVILGYCIHFFESVALQCPIPSAPCKFQKLCIATLLAWIVSTRFLSFSKCAHALCGMNPTPNVGIPMMPNKISEAKCTNKGHLTCSICYVRAWNSSHSNYVFFFTLSRALFSFYFCLARGLLKIQAFIAWWFYCLGPPTWIEGRPDLPTSMRSSCLLSKCWWSPFSRISVGAYINLALPPWPFVHPFCIFHCMIWWYFYLITFMWSHQSPYKNSIQNQTKK